jgi:lysophospholipase L1-like esterase
MIDVQRRAEWLTPWRLPVADLELHHPALALPAMCPSGVRLRLRTASRRLRLDAEPVHLRAGLAFPALCELLVEGVPSAVAGLGPRGVEFDRLPAGMKQLELWLPIVPGVRIRGLRALDGAALFHAPPEPRPRWTVYGSSITQGMGTSPAQTWPAVAARRLGRSVTNLGYSGACLLDPLVAQVIAQHPADYITLEIGINIHNTAGLRERTMAPALHGFLATIRSRRPRVPIVVLGPVHGGERERSTLACRLEWDGKGLEIDGDLTLAQIREVLEEVVSVLQRRGDSALTWADGRSLFGAADADAGGLPDGLHPDAHGQVRMGERYAALERCRRGETAGG